MTAPSPSNQQRAAEFEKAPCGMQKPGETTTCIEPAGHAGEDGRGASHGDGSIICWIYR